MFTSGLGGLCQHCFGQFFGSGGVFRWMGSMGYMGLTFNAPMRLEKNGLRHVLEGKDVLVLELWQFRIHLKWELKKTVGSETLKSAGAVYIYIYITLIR